MLSNIKNLFSQSEMKLVKGYEIQSFSSDTCFYKKFDYKVCDFNSELFDITNSKDITFTYYIDVYKKQHISLLDNYRFDLIFLKPMMIGREYSKTASLGYFYNEDLKSTIIQILSGEGYVLVEDLKDDRNLKIVKVSKGSYVYVPNGFVFILINKSDSNNLVALTLTSRKTQLRHSLLEKENGATLYYTRTGFVKNKNAKPYYTIDEHFGDYVNNFSFDKKKGLYLDFIELPERFVFLK